MYESNKRSTIVVPFLIHGHYQSKEVSATVYGDFAVHRHLEGDGRENPYEWRVTWLDKPEFAVRFYPKAAQAKAAAQWLDTSEGRKTLDDALDYKVEEETFLRTLDGAAGGVGRKISGGTMYRTGPRAEWMGERLARDIGYSANPRRRRVRREPLPVGRRARPIPASTRTREAERRLGGGTPYGYEMNAATAKQRAMAEVKKTGDPWECNYDAEWGELYCQLASSREHDDASVGVDFWHLKELLPGGRPPGTHPPDAHIHFSLGADYEGHFGVVKYTKSVRNFAEMPRILNEAAKLVHEHDRKEAAEEARLGHTPNVVGAGQYWVWRVQRKGDEPYLMAGGPYGPHDLQGAKTFARIGATEGTHDRAVSKGRDPKASGFEIVRVYEAGTGERAV